MSYSISKKTLKLASGKKVEFEYPIYKAVEIGDVIVVCLGIPVDRQFNENVFAVDRDGRVLWQVNPVTPIKPISKGGGYVGIGNAAGLVRLFNWDGMVYDVDPNTGVVVSSYFGK